MIVVDLRKSLHVVSGEAAAASVRIALRLGHDQVLFGGDPISVGPAPAVNDLAEWQLVRERFNNFVYGEMQYHSFEGQADNRLLRNLGRLSDGMPVIVWVAVGVPEQLFLAWIVFLFDHLKLDLSMLGVIQFENLRARQRVLGIGELSAENISDFRPEPRQLDSAELMELRRAWRVYTSSDPKDLASYITEASTMPVLYQAVSQLVYRYPDLQTGIGICDERLLHYTAKKGPNAARVIGYSMSGDDIDYFGDTYLFSRLTALANTNLPSPLISLTGNTKVLRECEVKLSTFGQKVLSGEANHVQVNGINDWVGGVHLSSKGSVTFRDGDTLVLPG